MQKQPIPADTVHDDRNDILARIPGAADAAKRIRDAETVNALQELLRAATRLRLQPQHVRLGKESGFAFGNSRYPLCRVNAAKGIAFHGHRRGKALIIHADDDDAFRLATGILRRLALSIALDR